MAPKLLADTSILIELQRGNEKIIAQFNKLKNKIYISRITACEFIYGSRNSREKKINKDFLEQLPILEIDSQSSLLAYTIIDQFGLKTKLGIADALIAAQAISHDLQLWTLNEKHFSEITGLVVAKEH
jgi:tRNA(fMet)-specific endonuclease VapC